MVLSGSVVKSLDRLDGFFYCFGTDGRCIENCGTDLETVQCCQHSFFLLLSVGIVANFWLEKFDNTKLAQRSSGMYFALFIRISSL
jgi:hypothetical protein